MPWEKEKLDKKRMFNKELKKLMDEKKISQDKRTGLARIFNAELDEFGFCAPEVKTKVHINIKNKKVEVII